MPEFITDFIYATAGTMETPRAWGLFHICFFVFGLSAATLAASLLARRLSHRTEKIMTFVLGILLLLSEIYKQLFHFVIDGGYRFDLIPFQLCSIPMYICLVLPFLPDGKPGEALSAFLGSYGLLGGLASYIAPGSMCHPYLALTLHSFVWHLLIFFIGLYYLLSRRAGRDIRHFCGAGATYLALCLVAFGINLACLGCPGVIPVNMFYIGPAPSPLPVCRDIVAAFGWYVNTPLYMATVSAGAAAVYFSPSALSSIIKVCRRGRQTEA